MRLYIWSRSINNFRAELYVGHVRQANAAAAMAIKIQRQNEEIWPR